MADRKLEKYAQHVVQQLQAEVAEWKQAAGVEAGLRREFLARAERLRLELEKIGWMDEFLDADGAKAMLQIARDAVNDDEARINGAVSAPLERGK